MPWDSMSATHSVIPLTQEIRIGKQTGINRFPFRAATPVSPLPQPANGGLACTVCPGEGHEVYELGERSFVIPHQIFFNSEPLVLDANDGTQRRLNEKDRLQWVEGGNVILRLTSVPVPLGGLGRQWRLDAESRTEDQATVPLE